VLVKFFYYLKVFKLPAFVVLGLILFILTYLTGLKTYSVVIALISILFGSYPLLKETIADIRKKQFGLDYIAILAVLVALLTQEYLVGIILALMLATGRNLEDYASSLAKKSLTALSERIPHDIGVLENDVIVSKPVKSVIVGEIIVVRKGEVVPLDGALLSENAVLDEASLTGEAYPADKYKGDTLRSGIVNVGDILRLKVTKVEKDSTYKKIVELVEKSQKEKAPIVRLADKYSIYFTLLTFLIAFIAFVLHGSLESILAVLVVATPCPLILATPIALIGGMNAQAKRRIIIKKLASLESLSRVTTVVFDKTGTITLGKPRVVDFKLLDNSFDKENLLSISLAIERNSLHPLAKAVVEFGKKAKIVHATSITETVGKGIEGLVSGKKYLLTKLPADNSDMQFGLFYNDKTIAVFTFEDEIKEASRETINTLLALGLSLKIFTGDKYAAAAKLVKNLGIDIEIQADLKPEDKQKGIERLKKEKKVVAMVGDGINDAPALALADVGMVFADAEQTAASEAADVVLLGGNFSSVLTSIIDAKKTIKIAKQSIIWGIGLSVVAMVFASGGYINPVAGSILQEVIDVAVIINALRTSRI
jgi:heavy metal translocating P-type ATPase